MSKDRHSSESIVIEPPPPQRRVFSNRTLNLRSIKAIGFDMDYTLIHYRVEEWEHRAYEHTKKRLLERGWPVEGLTFDPTIGTPGLVTDVEAGNILKADRFGFVRRASHGTTMLPFEEQRRLYSREVIDLRDRRWVFMNTLFALSEACLFGQMVDLLDAGQLEGGLNYGDLYRAIRSGVDEAHMMGKLKAEIVADPDLFVELDPELAHTLLDLKRAGKKLLLITNSEWDYTMAMMAYAFDRYLPKSLASWRDLFDIVIVSARKPHFFTGRNPAFDIIDDDGLLKPTQAGIEHDGAFLGGDAAMVERHLGLSGSQILYVGDHIFTDVNLSKSLLRWRTAVVVRELEQDLGDEDAFRETQSLLRQLMAEKERLELAQATLRLQLQRWDHKGDKAPAVTDLSGGKVRQQLGDLKAELLELDDRIAPLAQAASKLGHPRWGLTMRAGNDKSHLARQIERYADVYTSRVSNFGLMSPFAYLRAPRSSLPHDPR